MPKFDPNNDYYKVLGVREDATQAEIQSAFRAGARGSHPDKEGDEETMRALNEAREVLGNPVARCEYDTQRNQQSSRFTAEIMAEGLQYRGSKSVSRGTATGLLTAGSICFATGMLVLLQIEDRRLWVLRALSLLLMATATLLLHSAARCRSPEATRKRLIARRASRVVESGARATSMP